MSETKFTSDHEWARLDDDGVVTVGITDFAQEQLGELVYVELPDIGREVSRGDEVAIIESVKAAGEVKAPVSGEVVAVNESLSDSPELVNESADSDGWFYQLRIASPDEMEELMDDNAYRELLDSLA